MLQMKCPFIFRCLFKTLLKLMCALFFLLLCSCAGTISTLGHGHDIPSPQMFPLSPEIADKILATAMVGEFAGNIISRVEFPNNGYQTTIRFGLDSHTFIAFMIPVKGRTDKGELVHGFAFEVSHSGTMLISGPTRSNRLYNRIIHDANLVSNPLPIVSFEPSKTRAKKPYISQGTGFFIGKLPMVVTNYHVVGDTEDAEIVLPNGQALKGRVIKRDEANDLAVISFNEFRNAPEGFRIFPSYKVKSGQDIYVIGYPLGSILGDSPSITKGIISATIGIGGDSRHFRITAQINPGNSGGPLVDTYGRVIGVVSHALNKLYIAKNIGHIPEGTNFAVKADVLLNMFNEIESLISEQTDQVLPADKIFSAYSNAVVIVRAISK